MRRFLLLVVVAMMVIGLMAGPAMAKQVVEGYAANSLGKTTLDTTVYSSSDEEMDYGDGIPNGEWITAKTQGVEIGLRATDSTDGLLDVTGTKGNRVGVYEVSTGYDEDSTAAEWNYEWSVDLGNATGNAADMMLTDYRLTLEQDFTEQKLWDVYDPDPIVLSKDVTSVGPYAASSDAVLTDYRSQQSWNPVFGNDDFDPEDEGTYHLRLVLTPETFNGPPLAVAIEVNVTDPS